MWYLIPTIAILGLITWYVKEKSMKATAEIVYTAGPLVISKMTSLNPKLNGYFWKNMQTNQVFGPFTYIHEATQNYVNSEVKARKAYQVCAA